MGIPMLDEWIKEQESIMIQPKPKATLAETVRNNIIRNTAQNKQPTQEAASAKTTNSTSNTTTRNSAATQTSTRASTSTGNSGYTQQANTNEDLQNIHKYRQAQNASRNQARRQTQTKPQNHFASNVKIVGNNVTEKDYEAFFEGFRNELQQDKSPRFGEMMNGALRHFGMSVPSQAKQTTKATVAGKDPFLQGFESTDDRDDIVIISARASQTEPRDKFDSRVREQYAARERSIDFSNIDELKSEYADIEAAEKHNPNSDWYKRLERAWNSGDLETYKKIENEMKLQKDRVNYILENRDRTYDDNFTGQFGASYRAGRMGQDEALAWNEYYKNPTLLNKEYAESVSETLEHFRKSNADTLADDATLPWISQSLAGNIPQLFDQTKAGVAGAAGAGLTSGFMASVTGNPLAMGTAALNGAKAGYSAGVAKHSFDTMRGAAFKKLLDRGMDEKTARAAANDEAFLSSLIEMTDSGMDIDTAFDAIFNPKAAGAKGVVKLLGKAGLNILGESLEEGLQESISIANESRDGTGIVNLLGNTGSSIRGAVTSTDPAARQRILDAMSEGAKLSTMIAGPGIIAGRAVNNQFGNSVEQTEFNDFSFDEQNIETEQPVAIIEDNYDVEAQIKFPSIQYPGDDPSIPPGEGFEWRGKYPPSEGLGAWYNPKTDVSMHWDLNHADPIGPHWDYIDENDNGFRIYKDGRIELSRIGGRKI